MQLVIVESPAKTRTIRGFLGPGWQVAASFGHVRDLPSSGGLAVGFRDGRVQPQYVVLDRSRQRVAELAALAAGAERVLLATDPDREGEAIAWHVGEVLGRRDCQRVVFNAITKSAVTAAIAKPRALDQHLVDAQQARRVLDRVVGWLVSPTLRRLGNVDGQPARSAGRVQSVAVRLVAEREREIQAFTAVDHFVLWATLEKTRKKPAFSAKLVAWKGEPLGQRLVEAAVAERTVAWCAKQPWTVLRAERRDAERQPPPPFTTASVQQAASVQLKLAPDATMAALQQLFEAGHITYHRTDSVNLAPEAIYSARALIAARFAPAYLPVKPVIHTTAAANAQEAHEAIRPTHPESGPDAEVGQHRALYRLIWLRFVASQMANGRDQHTTIDVACAPGKWNGGPMGVFQAKGTVVQFDGWRALAGDDATDEKTPKKRGKTTNDDAPSTAKLPLLTVGDALTLLELKAKLTTTKPPPRFTQASLIRKLELAGIGRPSTYATIMRTIVERGYVVETKRLLHATEMGLRLTDFLVAHFAGNFIDANFTARLEQRLDAIARGEEQWERVVTEVAHGVLALAQHAGLRGNPLVE